MANNDGEEVDDLGALIYREIQLRKAEAAAAVAEKKKTSTASTHRNSTRKRLPFEHDDKPLPTPKRNDATNRRKREAPMGNDRPKKKVAKKKHKYECSA